MKKIDKIIEYINAEEHAAQSFSKDEQEIALKVLDQLSGLTVIRASRILQFCLKAIGMSRI